MLAVMYAGAPHGAGASAAAVCQNGVCDGKDPATAAGDRSIDPQSWVWYRKITLHISDGDNMGWASVDGASPGDEVYIDRSWDHGSTWEPKLGDAFVPSGSGGWRTSMYFFDDPANNQKGLLRACAIASGQPDVGCTPWVAAADATPDMYHGTADTLISRYDHSIDNWSNTTGWWRSANAITALVDYIDRTGDCTYWPYVQLTYANNNGNNFTNNLFDDTGWWGLAWMRASDVAPRCQADGSQFLSMAKFDFNYIQTNGWDNTPISQCGGGVWWTTDKQYKASIATGLFMELGAGLYARTQDSNYLQWATGAAEWFVGFGYPVLTAAGLVQDGLDPSTCTPIASKGQTATWTYNQGAFIGGMTQLAIDSPNDGWLPYAEKTAQATIGSLVWPNGVLREDQETANPPSLGTDEDKTGDQPIFKGVFMRELRLLYDNDAASPSRSSWLAFMHTQTQSLVANDRSAWTEFGFHWAGPIRVIWDDTFSSQTAALDAFNAQANL